MNVLSKFQIRHSIKFMIIWTISLILFIIVCTTKFDTIAGTDPAAAQALFDTLPRSLQVIFGIGTADITTLAGYYTVLVPYFIITFGILAVSLGAKSIAREEEDKTSDFIFTKPISRTKIYFTKYVTSLCIFTTIFLITFICNYLYLLKYNQDISFLIDQYLAIYLISIFMFSLSSFLSTLNINKISNLLATSLLLIFYIINVIIVLFDIKFIYISPFSAFNPSLMLTDGIPIISVLIYTCLSIVLLVLGKTCLLKKDIRG